MAKDQVIHIQHSEILIASCMAGERRPTTWNKRHAVLSNGNIRLSLGISSLSTSVSLYPANSWWTDLGSVFHRRDIRMITVHKAKLNTFLI